MMHELSHDQMQVKKVHRFGSEDLPAYIKAGNMDTLFGFCSIRMMYDEVADSERLKKKFWISQEKNSHLFNQENTIELMMRGEDIRSKLLKLKNERIPNQGIQELLNLIDAIHRIEQEQHEKDIFKTHISKQPKLLKIKKLALDFDQSELVLEIDPIVRYSNTELYDSLMAVILSHQYIVEHYPTMECMDVEVVPELKMLVAK